MNLSAFCKAAAVRAVRTAAQAAVAAIGTTAMFEQVHWGMVGSTALLAAVMSLLMAFAGLPEVPREGGNE